MTTPESEEVKPVPDGYLHILCETPVFTPTGTYTCELKIPFAEINWWNFVGEFVVISSSKWNQSFFYATRNMLSMRVQRNSNEYVEAMKGEDPLEKTVQEFRRELGMTD